MEPLVVLAFPSNEWCGLVLAVLIVSIAALNGQWRKQKIKEDFGHPTPDDGHHTPSPPRLAAKLEFLERVGDLYGYGNSQKGFIDIWRTKEFPFLIPPIKLQPNTQQMNVVKSSDEHHTDDGDREVYLDYAGSAIPTRTLLSTISNNDTQILANPHSIGGGLASDRTLKLMQLSKDRIMQHFGIQHESFGLDELDNNDDDDKSCNTGYQLAFTSGATDSLRLVAERFPWNYIKVSALHYSCLADNDEKGLRQESSNLLKSIQAQSILLYPRNVHTSVIGMRQIALQRGAQFHCTTVDDLLGATSGWFQSLIERSMIYKQCQSVDEEKKDDKLHTAYQTNHEHSTKVEATTACKTIYMHHLLVLPLECNFGGDRFDWSKTVSSARNSCFTASLFCKVDGGNDAEQQSTTIRICHKWHILLDTAKAAATSPVHLPTSVGGGPDYAVVSFYKMFGSPTGLGALFIKKQRQRKRKRRNQHSENGDQRAEESDEFVINSSSVPPRHYFGGGSVDIVLSDEDFVVPRNNKPAAAPTTNHLHENEHVNLGTLVHGTEHFRGIVNLAHGFQELDDLGGMEAVSNTLQVFSCLIFILSY